MSREGIIEDDDYDYRLAGDQEAMSREGAAEKLLRDAALWREHDEWVTYKCNAEQMPRYAMLEAYGSPPIEKAVQAALDAA